MRRPRMPRPRVPRPRIPRPSRPRLPAAPAAVSWIGERIRGARYLVEDALYAVVRLVRALGAGIRTFWFSLNIYTRRRLGVAAGLVAVLLLVLSVAVPALPCAVPGGDECPPDDDAIALVPADALVYAHVNLDPGTEQYDRARDLAERVPTLAQVVAGSLLSRIPGPGGRPADFRRDVEPWFGGEAAVAIVPAAGGVAEEVQLIEAEDTKGATRFAKSIAAGEVAGTRHRGVDVPVDERGLATAVTGGFLVIGTESAVREAIDAESGGGGARSLADDEEADEARDALPDERIADAYLSSDGIAELVASPAGLLAQLSPFVDPGAADAAAAAAVVEDDGVRIATRSVLDSRRAKADPGFFSAFPAFEPGLAEALPEDSLGYLGLGEPGRALRSLLDQATTKEPGLVEAFGALVDEVKSIGGPNLEKDLLPALGGEAAFALEPAEGRGGAGLPQAGFDDLRTPFLEFIATDVDEEATRRALAGLQAPIARELGAEGVQAGFSQRRLDDEIEVQSLRVSPSVNLSYTVFEGALVVATDPTGIEDLAEGEDGLDEADSFEDATRDFSDETSVLLYLSLGELIRLAEQAGLSEDPAYATFAADVRSLEALGLAVRSDTDLLATDARVIVGEEDAQAGTGVPEPGD